MKLRGAFTRSRVPLNPDRYQGGMVSVGRAVSGGHGDLQGAGAPGPRADNSRSVANAALSLLRSGQPLIASAWYVGSRPLPGLIPRLRLAAPRSKRST